jgi:hypothetical protein
MADAIIASERAKKAAVTGGRRSSVEPAFNRDLGDLLVDGIGTLLSSLRH